MNAESEQSARDPVAPAICPLADMGLVEVAGADAETFLNAQLSRNVESGKPLRAPISAWLDARGRVLALVRALWTGESWLLLAKGADVEALIRRLRMFVLRADVQLRDASSEWQAVTVLGGIEPWLAKRSLAVGPHPGDTVIAAGAFAVRVGPRLAYLVSAENAMSDFETNGSADSGELCAVEEIRLGLVDLTPGLSGRYTAHMLNLDRLGAVSFDKGCYPGQEIVARTQNLGSVKRRVFRFSGDLECVPAVGSPLVDARNNRVGEIVRAAGDAGGRVELLAVVPLDAAADVLACDTGRILRRERILG